MSAQEVERDKIREQLLAEIGRADDLEALEDARVASLGRNGTITSLMKSVGQLEPHERKEAGRIFNSLKQEITTALATKQEELKALQLSARLASETVDITLPVRQDPAGTIHPISQTIDEMVTIFAQMGFVVADGPHIESDFNNFTALNIPPEHPARQEHDTFYLPEKEDGSRLVLRTHTSPVQIRTMVSQSPPIRIIVPGRTFRADYDATHSPMFHQIEGLVIDEETHMGHLKGCLIDFCRNFFDVDDLPVRFRPSYFPFTEPSAEMDIGCLRDSDGLKIGRQGNSGAGDWLEILGCGMVNPRVLQNCNIDPQRYQGFAFGLGIERAAMLKYGIPDLRTFFESDLRWLRHYGFSALDMPGAVGA
ncbi:MAG: phenylalanine--tRNA ligase subunit alpha [Pseudomonadota bacterium]|nr:phenylalanine--tRNA ligase subunit alpha [Pseudomonadota bacterium]